MSKFLATETVEFDGLEISNRYWFAGQVEIAVFNVDTETDRGTKWETEVKAGDIEIDSCYDSELDEEIPVEDWMNAAIKNYYETSYDCSHLL